MSVSTECAAALLSFRYASNNNNDNDNDNDSHCCEASVASKQQHKQDLRSIYIEGEKNSRIHHFLPECIAFNQSALRQFLPECIVSRTRMSRHYGIVVIFRVHVDSSKKVCSYLPVKRCKGDRA